MKSIYKVLLMGALAIGSHTNAQVVLQALDAPDTSEEVDVPIVPVLPPPTFNPEKTYICDAENLGKTEVIVVHTNGWNERYLCGMWYYGPRVIEYAFKSMDRTEEGFYDLYYRIPPRVLKTGDQVELTLARREYASLDDLVFQPTGEIVTVK